LDVRVRITINVADRCGRLIAREEDKLDPVWPKLKKKGINVGSTRTSPKEIVFFGRLVAKN